MVTQLIEEEENSENLFRVIRKELGFLNDYLHTRFPIVFADGFPFMYLPSTPSLSGLLLVGSR